MRRVLGGLVLGAFVLAPASSRRAFAASEPKPGSVLRVSNLVVSDFPGHAFCERCLAQKFGTDVAAARDAATALALTGKFQQERWFCSFCLRVEQVIHVPWLESWVRPGSAIRTVPDPLKSHVRPSV